MRVSQLSIAASLLSLARAAPGWQLPGSVEEVAVEAFDSAQSWVQHALQGGQDKLDDFREKFQIGVQSSFVNVHGIEYLSVEHPAFPLHRLRVVEPHVCDSSVKQLSGYLDVSETKHLFFWFQESRSKPKDDPLVLWLNGGPGCSSSTGLLFELGGCRIADNGNNVTYNEHSWNSVANVLFLDQPIGVGFSYSDGGEEVSTTPIAAEDVYAFLILFISQFEKYSKLDFHVSGESYAGHYVPNIANVIYQHNLALQSAPVPGLPTLNFKSVLIGNGLTDPLVQMPSLPDWACDGPYAVYTDPQGPECSALRTKATRCEGLVSSCYKTNSRFACVPAAVYCWSQLFGPLQQLGINMYDARLKCDRSEDKDGPLCYKEMGWMETFLNHPEIKAQLGAPADINFQSCNTEMNQKFLLQGDGMHNSGILLGPLLDSGIRVLIYAGEADSMCNFIGCSRVVDNLQSRYTAEYGSAKVHNFTDSDGEVVGWTKSAGKGAGNVAFVAFTNAGHMVPHDDPVGALTMFSKWLSNKPLA